MRIIHLVVLGIAVLLAAMLGRMGWVDWAAVGHAGVIAAFALVILLVIVLSLAALVVVFVATTWSIAEVVGALFADPSAKLAGPVPMPPQKAATALEARERPLSDQLSP